MKRKEPSPSFHVSQRFIAFERLIVYNGIYKEVPGKKMKRMKLVKRFFAAVLACVMMAAGFAYAEDSSGMSEGSGGDSAGSSAAAAVAGPYEISETDVEVIQ